MKNHPNSIFILSLISIAGYLFVNCLPGSAQGMLEHAGTTSMMGTLGGTTQGSTAKSLSKIYNKNYSVSGSQSNRNNKSADSKNTGNNKRQKFSDSEVQSAVKESDKFYRLGEEKEKIGKLEEAKQFYYKAALARVHIWGDSDPAVAKISLQIGEIEVKQKRPDSARLWFKKSLASLSKHYGPGDYELTTALEHLAKVEVSTNNHSAASSYYEHILGLEEKKWGEDSEKCLPTRISLIEQYLAAKDIDEADKQLNKAINIETAARGMTGQNASKLEQLRTSIQAMRAGDTGK